MILCLSSDVLFDGLSVEVHFQHGLDEVRPVSKGWRKSHQSIPKQEPRDMWVYPTGGKWRYIQERRPALTEEEVSWHF